MSQLEQKLSQVRQLADSICKAYGLKYELKFSDPDDKENDLSKDDNDDDDDDLTLDEKEIVQATFKSIEINPQDSKAVENYLIQCFDEFQQIPCKLIAKAWIRLIEPKKQSRYPYKLGDATKPLWWPANCRHKEPDHLRKDERIDLLVCIIRTFKARANELIGAAELVGEVNIVNGEASKVGKLSKRKINILGEMFKVLNATSGTVVVSKPGKKYSSKVYTRKLLQRRIDIQKHQPQLYQPHQPHSILPPAPQSRTPEKPKSNLIGSSFNTPTPQRLLLDPAQSHLRLPSTPDLDYLTHSHTVANSQSYGAENESLEPSLNSSNRPPLGYLNPNNFNLLLSFGNSSTDTAFGGFLSTGTENVRPSLPATSKLSGFPYSTGHSFDSDGTVSNSGSPSR